MGSAPSSDIAHFNPQWLLPHSWFEIVHGGQEEFNPYGARTMRELECGQMTYSFRWNQQRGLIEFQQDCIVNGASVRRKMGLVEAPNMKQPGFLVFYNITDSQCILTWRVLDFHPNWLVVENQNNDIQVYWSSPTIDVCSYRALMERLRTLGLPTNRFVVNNGVITQTPPTGTVAPGMVSGGLAVGPVPASYVPPAVSYAAPSVPAAIVTAPVAAAATVVAVPIAATGGAVYGAAHAAPYGVVYPQQVAAPVY